MDKKKERNSRIMIIRTDSGGGIVSFSSCKMIQWYHVKKMHKSTKFKCYTCIIWWQWSLALFARRQSRSTNYWSAANLSVKFKHISYPHTPKLGSTLYGELVHFTNADTQYWNEYWQHLNDIWFSPTVKMEQCMWIKICQWGLKIHENLN